MGFFKKLLDYSTKKEIERSYAEAGVRAAQIKVKGAGCIKQLYNIDPSTMTENEKAAFCKNIFDKIFKIVKRECQKYKNDKKFLNKVRESVVKDYGIDKELLDDVNSGMIRCRIDSSSPAIGNQTIIYICYACTEVEEIVGYMVGDSIVSEVLKDKELKDLVDGGALEIGEYHGAIVANLNW